MTLKDKTAEFQAHFAATASQDVKDAMTAADAEVRVRKLAADALKAGDHIPMFKLRDVDGQSFDLEAVLATGPAIISFYRGDWCPYCSLELRAWEEAMPEIVELGASVIAVSPQASNTKLPRKLPFTNLVDPGSTVAAQFGLAFELSRKLRPVYTQFGHPLPKINEGQDWLLPIPATYVVDQNGAVLLAFIDPDYRNRLEPADVISALRQLNVAKAR